MKEHLQVFSHKKNAANNAGGEKLGSKQQSEVSTSPSGLVLYTRGRYIVVLLYKAATRMVGVAAVYVSIPLQHLRLLRSILETGQKVKLP